MGIGYSDLNITFSKNQVTKLLSLLLIIFFFYEYIPFTFLVENIKN